MKNILFLHPNFPGQFKLIARELAARSNCSVAAIGQGERSKEIVSNIEYHYYERLTGAPAITFPPMQVASDNLRRGRSVADLMIKMRNRGFYPDHVIAHPGWGDATFVKEVFPTAHYTTYMEYYYRGMNSDIDFDLEFQAPAVDLPYARLRNITNMLAFSECDEAITPTTWQASLFPEKVKSQLRIQHDGIDCGAAAPAVSTFQLPNGQIFSKGDEVVTYVSRSLEPYRGFHIFMRALPRLLSARPNAQIVIVGKEGVSYGKPPANGQSWKAVLLRELEGSLDLARVHFVDRIPYSRLIDLFNVSSVHVYLTYPFVLSWSLLEAMACECAVIASDTGPVTEVIIDKQTGILVDFFNAEKLAHAISELLPARDYRHQLGKAARSVIFDRYDFRSRVLPEYEKLLKF